MQNRLLLWITKLYNATSLNIWNFIYYCITASHSTSSLSTSCHQLLTPLILLVKGNSECTRASWINLLNLCICIRGGSFTITQAWKAMLHQFIISQLTFLFTLISPALQCDLPWQLNRVQTRRPSSHRRTRRRRRARLKQHLSPARQQQNPPHLGINRSSFQPPPDTAPRPGKSRSVRPLHK